MKKIQLFCALLFVCTLVHAQDQQLITYHGQFRTLLNDSRLSGKILDGDTTSPRRGALGTAFFDFGINVAPNENFKILSEFRMRNIIGQNDNFEANNVNGIGSTGNNIIDARMIFRQVRAEGKIKGIVDYQIGDIDLSLSKYTLYRGDEVFDTYESSIYAERRTIAQYENFQFDNNWRVQGVTAKTKINARKYIRSVELMGFGARTRMNNAENTLDRLLVGGQASITQSNYLKLGGNVISFFDLAGTALDTLSIYKNNVMTGTFEITPLNKEKFKLTIEGENGMSSNSYFVEVANITVTKNDYFMDMGAKFTYKPAKASIKASYMNVGHDFTSPGAQSLSVRNTATPLFFGTVLNQTYTRYPGLYDRYADETIYNQRITPGLMVFLPQYGNVLPYGAATPNRNGLIIDIDRTVDTSHVLSYSARVALLSENVAEGSLVDLELRKFSQLQGGVKVNVAKLIEFKKSIDLTFGARIESTKREGNAAVDLSSTFIDAGISVEVFDGIYVLAAMKQFAAKGTEVITERDEYGDIKGYTYFTTDQTQNIISTAIKLDLFKNSFASFEYNTINFKDKQIDTMNHTIGNLLINFTLRF